MKFCFGDIVVVENNLIGVVVKTWVSCVKGQVINNYDVYVRMHNEIKNFREEDIDRYMVRHKYLDEDEMYYQYNATHGL